ncbi:WhiB family transcriptional regulator [Rhodococcus sp. X156]|uniref:WhiB family transcriptional regulator n=1 Tax=Rhodococcus sp. X156 TaxID=2499145 RepID=UPI000FD77969|nr:WhiB family transcriptional regulator [Rhodococcus sp. X156]
MPPPEARQEEIDTLPLPCRHADADLWFAESPTDVEHAKTLCGHCPLRQRCLADALDRAEPWGVWGGELLQHGCVVSRKRPRGRPRKHPVPREAS